MTIECNVIKTIWLIILAIADGNCSKWCGRIFTPNNRKPLTSFTKELLSSTTSIGLSRRRDTGLSFFFYRL